MKLSTALGAVFGDRRDGQHDNGRGSVTGGSCTLAQLGGAANPSAWAFNLTLLIAGLVIVCLADFVASDFARLAWKVKGGLSSRGEG